MAASSLSCSTVYEPITLPHPSTGEELQALNKIDRFMLVPINNKVTFPAVKKTAEQVSAESRKDLQSEMDKMLKYSFYFIALGVAGSVASILIGNKIVQTVGFIALCLGGSGALTALFGIGLAIHWKIAFIGIGGIFISGIAVLLYKCKDYSIIDKIRNKTNGNR